MRVVPECARLIRDAELVQERMARRDRALVDAHRSVSPVGTFLEQTMPMLYRVYILSEHGQQKCKWYRSNRTITM
jgi:hypothetical protein